MNLSLKHRGPDATDIVVLENELLAMGHRRLSIIDLDKRSTQPMRSNSGRYIIVFNGEVYNYKELKALTDYDYRTDSDTEVILAYVEKYGFEEFLNRSNGMFAIALYDTEKKELLLARDRMGIKPLYYYYDSECLVFSSEVKGVLNSGLVKAVLDKESLDDYFAYRYCREPYTFFENIKQVNAASYLKICQDTVEECVYWEIPNKFNEEKVYDEELILNKFEQMLESSVKRRMMSDVPLGTYLSGGVDSSILTAIVAANTEEKINTYTIGFDELNEFDYSDMVADRYNTSHHKIKMSQEDYFNVLEEVIEYKDAPLGIPNEVPLAVMSRELKKKITVVLSGEGADELLGGYGRIFRAPFDYKNGKSNDFYDYFIHKYEYVNRKLRDKILVNNRRNEYDKKVRKVFEEHSNEYNVFYFFHKYHVKGLLQRVDITTMLTGVEARVPFLDHELIEFVYEQVPYSMKLKWKEDVDIEWIKDKSAKEYSEVFDIPKYILKKMAYKYLPEEVIERRKVGFPVPLVQWEKQMEEMFLELYKYSIMGPLSGKEIIDLCKKENNYAQILWMLLNLSIFVNKYFDKEWRW